MTTAIETLPLLENGDNLTREEFHRRYELRDDDRKVELIDGVVYVASPTRDDHSFPHLIVSGWAANYVLSRPETRAYDNGTLLLLDDSEVQPDVMIVRLTGPNATSRRTDSGYREGPPELVFEVAASRASKDLHQKKRLYERAGVQEYLVWRTLSNAFDWFDLENGVYVARQPDAQGVIESRVFPGLRLPVTKLLAGDYAAVLAAVAPPAPAAQTE